MAEISEFDSQCFIFEWAEKSVGLMPELRLLCSRIAGVKLSIFVWKKLKKAGYKKGASDIVLPIARCNYHSLNIELKKPSGGRVSPEQKQWISDLNKYGNLGVVVHGHINAINVIKCYLRGDEDGLKRLIK